MLHEQDKIIHHIMKSCERIGYLYELIMNDTSILMEMVKFE